jgi:hypothetical protein
MVILVKTIFTILALVLFVDMAFTQVPFTIKDPQNTDVTGGSYTVYGQPADPLLEARLSVTNNLPDTTTVRCHRYEVSVVAATGNYYHWGVGLGIVAAGIEWLLPDVGHPNYTDVVQTFPPGFVVPADGLTYGANHVPNGTSGTSTYRYVWLDESNHSDSVYCDVIFVTGTPSAIDDVSANDYTLGEAMPNPASENVTINFELSRKISNASIVIYNTLGAVVESYPIAVNSRSLSFDVNELHAGLYFYTLVADGQALKTKRLVVR